MARTNSHTDGLLVVDKPSGWTSHDVVGKCRRIVGQKRVGHAGTLDPGATGVLLVGLGRATRLMTFVSELQKSYVGEVVLGTATNTLDDEGEVTESWNMDGTTVDDVRNAAQKFVGAIEQIPPMVSAIKVGGKRLHELAREGIEIERKARQVHVYRLEVSSTDEPHVFRIEVDCSSGTYVRTLAADVGTALGGGAHLRRLRRTAIGQFTEHDATDLEILEKDWRSHLLTPATMVGHIPHVVASDEVQTAIRYGRKLTHDQLGASGDGRWAIVDEGGDLLALYQSDRGQLRAQVVLAAQ